MGPELRTVLLVEDDPADVRMIRRAFELAGVNRAIVEFNNGDDALSYLKGEASYANRKVYPRPDLMILDLKLPRRSGFEVLQWTRGVGSELRRMPVVILSSSCEPIDVDRAYDLGANSYICKPARTAEWLHVATAVKTYWLMLNVDPDPGLRRHAG